MRIIAGRFKSRVLHAPAGRNTRPTTDRVREALFNWLIHHPDVHLKNARIADLFAGTGALGLEALSRGATFTAFVEKDRNALAALRRNIDDLNAVSETRIFPLDATHLPKSDLPFDIVFLDPPYHSPLGQAALQSARQQNWLTDATVILWETSVGEEIPHEKLNLKVQERRQYGDTALNLLRA